MKKLILTLSLSLVLMASLSWAQEADEHTPDYCAKNNANVCAHLGHMSGLTSTTEGHFVVHVSKTEGFETQDMDVKLMMHMGHHSHGSAPVKLTQFAPNKYKVDNAWFVMTGLWSVDLTFKLNGQVYDISIPVEIKN